jgi:hypothetical protein
MEVEDIVCAVVVIALLFAVYYWFSSSATMPAVATTVQTSAGTAPAVVVPATAAASTVQTMVGGMHTLPFERMDPVGAIVGGKRAVMVPVNTSMRGGKRTYNYVGCFIDNNNRAMKTQVPGYLTMAQCYAAAKNAGAAYFSMENPAIDGSGTAQCYIGSSGYDQYGTSQQCTRFDPSGNAIGATRAASVYRV